MKQSHYLLKGTFLLTAAGLLSRTAGFFYKIFLSRAIGAEEIGLYHLCMPVYMFCMAAAVGGVQTAVSRFTAEYYAARDRRGARRILACALTLSLSISLLLSVFLYLFSDTVAVRFLSEARCASLLRVAAFSLPFSVLHSCVCGYFIGKKRVAIPAASQLVEQLLRVGAVFFFYTALQSRGQSLDSSVMMLGQVAGDLAAALFCLYFLLFSKEEGPLPLEGRPGLRGAKAALLPGIRKTMAVSAPLALNRMLICVLQAIEAALLPQQLRLFGLTSSEALAVYGTLTGMALPLILFPTAVTGSVGTLLLPLVSEARTLNQEKRITATTTASFQGSLLLGLFFLALFFLFGRDIGLLLFGSAAAGEYIRRLSLICPFLYINTTLVSILHGIGKTAAASVQNTLGFVLRLAAALLLVPGGGIRGYLAGVLVSQALVTACALFTLGRDGSFRPSLTRDFIRPVFLCVLTVASMSLLRFYLPFLTRGSLLPLLANGGLCLLIFGALVVCGYGGRMPGRHL